MRSNLVTSLLAGMTIVFSGCDVLTDSGITAAGVAVKELRCEYRFNPLGVDVVKPRLLVQLEIEYPDGGSPTAGVLYPLV